MPRVEFCKCLSTPYPFLTAGAEAGVAEVRGVVRCSTACPLTPSPVVSRAPDSAVWGDGCGFRTLLLPPAACAVLSKLYAHFMCRILTTYFTRLLWGGKAVLAPVPSPVLSAPQSPVLSAPPADIFVAGIWTGGEGINSRMYKLWASSVSDEATLS